MGAAALERINAARNGQHLPALIQVILIVAMVAVAVIVGAIAGVSQLFAQMERPTTVTNPGEVVTVTIPSGASTADIAQILVDEGVITSTGDFKKAVKDQDASTSIYVIYII